jgi:glycosyltransferase involved in cell wall biosynthesis/2-polyprenyl-3-methyl-5-hydroxy-6-metoxy-1,4-benzoquinol methylase
VKRIGIIVVAYNAASTLAKVLDRIPRDFVPRIDQILICDNASEDQTYLVGLGYKQVDGRALPLNVVRNPRNLGYGGNQKVGYEWAIEHGLDIVVLLHADGQYAPEFLPQIVAPLEADEADAVFGSRMMTRGGARGGGMPFYKFVGNKVLTTFENRVVGTHLSEWHSGYRAYSVATLREIPFRRNTDEYDFDTEIIIQLHEAGKRIVELPIPTYYGEEISYVNGTRYAKDIVLDVLRYRAHKIGLGSGETAFASSPYEPKGGPDTAAGRMLAWMSGRQPERVMVVAADHGVIGAELTARGHDVVGVQPSVVGGDERDEDEVGAALLVDLECGLPESVGAGFDTIVLVDALGRVRRPDALLADAAAHLGPGGRILASVPNFGHWYPRARVASGRWGYDQRGILDESTVRFFAPRATERLFADAGLTVRRREHVGLPLGAASEHSDALAIVDGVGLVLAPSLFAYQNLYELEPVPS